jgi:hypothetical protein
MGFWWYSSSEWRDSAISKYTVDLCGRYTLRTPWQPLAEHFGLDVSVTAR